MIAHATPPAWLFSFVDLAFLLLIAMTQLAADSTRQSADAAPDLGSIIVPRIDAGSALALPTAASDAWQLRVHPRANARAGKPAQPFELLRGPSGERPERIDVTLLRERLAQLSSTKTAKPLLAPHEDSRSRDLFTAVALLEEHWPKDANRRRATVTRVAAR